MLLVFLNRPGILNAQENDPVKDILESMAESQPEDYDWSELGERLAFYLKHPIGLCPPAEQLKELAFLSPLQVANLQGYLKQYGGMTDLLELQSINGFDIQTISRLLPFVVLRQKTSLPFLRPDALGGNHDLIVRYGRVLQTQKGFTALPGSRYLGSPDKMLLRYRYAYADVLSMSVVAEKDAGEYWLRKGSGTDHLSFNLTIGNAGRLKRLVLGDYSLQFGQGLTLWSGFAFGKGPDVTSVAGKDAGLRPYQSANEASFFRGLAGTVQIDRYLSLTPFISLRNLDASLKIADNGTATLENINVSGLHRTKTEMKNQHSLKQLVYGAALQYTKNALNVGVTGYSSDYGHNFVTGTQRYNLYAFSGEHLVNTGAYYNYTFRDIYFFGELAHSQDGGWALLNGALASLSPRTSLVLLHRDYDRDYHNFFSNAVGEATETSNEKGVYLGINYAPWRKWMFSAYADYFRFPWLKYRVNAPSDGYELLTQVNYLPDKRLKVNLRYKREIKQQNPDAGSKGSGLEMVNKQALRMDWSLKPRGRFGFHQRMESAFYKKGNRKGESGYILLQDIDYRPATGILSGNARLAYFFTPSYNSRIYVYEDDVLYGAGSAAYSGAGFRTYLNLRIRAGKHIDLWTRVAQYIYQNRDAIGTGLDEISGNKKTEVKLQLRYQF